MPKRKHSEVEHSSQSSKDPNDKVNEVKATRLRHKFERGTQLLFRALKTARGFERQKLGRRQKTARQDGDSKSFDRLTMEVQVLKSLDLEQTAERYLYKQLIKTKRISDIPEFMRLEKSLKSLASTAPRDPAEANVTARLFKSNPVQKDLPEILTDIRTLLGVNEIGKKPQQQQQPPQLAKQQTSEEDNDELANKLDVTAKQPESLDSEEWNGFDDDASMNNDTDEDEDEDSEEKDDNESLDLSQFDFRLAPPSDESEEEEDDDDDDDDGHDDYDDEHLSKKDLLTDDISVSSASTSISYEEPSRSPSPPPAPPKPAPPSTLTSKSQPKDTTFLPSLTMGGYWSGSDDEMDIDPDETTTKPAPRKNRMGQQARRALWEKKYGSKANHIQKEQNQNQQNPDRKGKGRNSKNGSSGWDAQRGATDNTSYKPKWAKRRDGEDTRSSSASGLGFSATTPNKRRREENAAGGSSRVNEHDSSSKDVKKSLHPSWEAARKAKEQQKTQASFQGRKIVFD